MLAALVPIVLGLTLWYFAEDVAHARRFGPVIDGSRSAETGGAAFRLFGLLLVAAGVAEFGGVLP